MFKRITEDSDASVNHQIIQRPIFTYEVNDGIAIGAICLDGDASGSHRQFFCGFTLSGVAEN
ncbi:hypothetical protein SARI_01307 [Salmonella enterica subsp. arizonae serovar 62:z4,z23:-]|uniref:Uncharacterized protein n=1 Tax=Salmonella arizonae (strain ATCC BAA-731 / CDC346-86 / RSK2980) TaxID=41514 RepID=A9MQ66_SALAR|nr:hypothetical protein SARI_01307 [Salmonella enterica subsp. arizonae serovar 62:z4,z23:-]